MPNSSQTSSSRRRLPKWLKVTIVSLLVVANIVVLTVFWAINTGQGVLATANTDSQVSNVLDEATGDDLTFLVIGSDSRAGLDDLTHFGTVGGARGDVIMLVRFDSSTSAVQILSIPRDLYVDIAGHGQNRINAAYAFGGPSLMVETIRDSLGVEINHYVEIDFVGFQSLIDELGGIELWFPYPARDLKSGLDVDAGTQTLDGDTALAYARSRKYQELQNGTWVSVNADDIGRTKRQQEVVGAIVAELKRPSSITEAGDIAKAMARQMTIDSTLATSSVASLAWTFRGILTGSIEGATLPTYGMTIDGRSVLIADEPDASAVLANFRAGTVFSSQPLRVQVLNGNGVKGSAGDMSRTLESMGFLVESVGDADTANFAQTIVLVPDGSGNGEIIVDALGFGVVQVGSVDNGYDAVVIVGADAP
ncbi:MAG: LytR family transcriptional regulator [Acidobacteria bacterium]|nr:MAG: LytR family transcriptional regulator [Acidobacteriota bacterium]